MFRCQLCEKVVPSGTRTQKIVLATRARTYGSRGHDPSERFRGRGRRNTPKKKFDKGGEGREIVREASVCPECAAKHEQEMAQQEAQYKAEAAERKRKAAAAAAEEESSFDDAD